MFWNSIYDSTNDNANEKWNADSTTDHWKGETGLVEVALASPAEHDLAKASASDKKRSLSSEQEEGYGTCCLIICCLLIIVVVIVLIIGLIDGGSGGGGSGGGGSFVGFLRTSGGSGSRGGGGGGRGGSSGGSCFPAGQGVSIEGSKKSIAIEALVPGTDIQNGGKVTVLMKLQSSEPLYRYNNSVLVTGSHTVYEFGDWKPVEDSALAVPVPYDDSFVYNIITGGHQIVINATVFKDWEEWDETVQNWSLQKAVLNLLNSDRVDHRLPKTMSGSAPIGEGAFASDTPIMLSDGSSKPIGSVQPGERLHDMSKVFSVMQLYIPPDTAVFEYRGHIVTEWTVVFEPDEQIWRNVRFSPNAKRLDQTPEAWYQLWTTNHRVPVQGDLVFADYHVIDEDDPVFSAEL